MRITNQMMQQTAKKTGIPLQQNTLLDILNKSSSPSNSLLPSVESSGSTNTFLEKLNNKSNKQLKEAAESLSDYAAKLAEDGEGSLFAKAEASKDTSELVEHIKGMAQAYNNTLKHLNGSDSGLERFYRQELNSYLTEHADALKKVGVTKKKDGGISIDEKTLKAADIDSLKAAFGSSSGFSEKVGYVAGRVAENSRASSAGILGGYNSSGMDFWNSFTKAVFSVLVIFAISISSLYF